MYAKQKTRSVPRGYRRHNGAEAPEVMDKRSAAAIIWLILEFYEKKFKEKSKKQLWSPSRLHSQLALALASAVFSSCPWVESRGVFPLVRVATATKHVFPPNA